MRSRFTRFGVSFAFWSLANSVLRPTVNVSIAFLKRIVSFSSNVNFVYVLCFLLLKTSPVCLCSHFFLVQRSLLDIQKKESKYVRKAIIRTFNLKIAYCKHSGSGQWYCTEGGGAQASWVMKIIKFSITVRKPLLIHAPGKAGLLLWNCSSEIEISDTWKKTTEKRLCQKSFFLSSTGRLQTMHANQLARSLALGPWSGSLVPAVPTPSFSYQLFSQISIISVLQPSKSLQRCLAFSAEEAQGLKCSVLSSSLSERL